MLCPQLRPVIAVGGDQLPKLGRIYLIINLLAFALSPSYLNEIQKLKVKEISTPIGNKNSRTILKLNEIKKQENKIKKDELKERILSKKKEEKLSLFSRSHFSNLEQSISINFL
mgnify:CR=1 FL=1